MAVMEEQAQTLSEELDALCTRTEGQYRTAVFRAAAGEVPSDVPVILSTSGHTFADFKRHVARMQERYLAAEKRERAEHATEEAKAEYEQVKLGGNDEETRLARRYYRDVASNARVQISDACAVLVDTADPELQKAIIAKLAELEQTQLGCKVLRQTIDRGREWRDSFDNWGRQRPDPHGRITYPKWHWKYGGQHVQFVPMTHDQRQAVEEHKIRPAEQEAAKAKEDLPAMEKRIADIEGALGELQQSKFDPNQQDWG